MQDFGCSGADAREPSLGLCVRFRESREHLRNTGFHPVQSGKDPDSLLGRHNRATEYRKKSPVCVEGTKRFEDSGIANRFGIGEWKRGAADPADGNRGGGMDRKAGEAELLLRQFSLRQT